MNYCIPCPQLNDLYEMDKFLETCNLPRMNHEEIENLNRPITYKGIDSNIKHLPAKKRRPGVTGEHHQTFRKGLTSILLIFFQKTKEGTIPDSAYEASITVIPKPGKDIMRKKQTSILYKY